MIVFAIDDEKLSLLTIERILKDEKPDVDLHTFLRGQAALDCIKDDGIFPNIVFCDIEMPGLSGLQFAVELKKISPDSRIVFVTAYSEYAIEAFKVKATGYVLKPVTKEAILEEMADIPTEGQALAMDQEKLVAHCFGHFEIFYGNQPVLFKRKQTKELMAYLIDREGSAATSEEIGFALWEDDLDAIAVQQRIRNLISDLRNSLKAIGMEDVLVRSHRQVAVRRDKIDCDYYRMLDGDMEAVNSFRGEYMIDYSWAELTTAKLYFHET